MTKQHIECLIESLEEGEVLELYYSGFNGHGINGTSPKSLCLTKYNGGAYWLKREYGETRYKYMKFYTLTNDMLTVAYNNGHKMEHFVVGTLIEDIRSFKIYSLDIYR